MKPISIPWKPAEILTLVATPLLAIAAGCGLLIPGFYDGAVQPDLLNGTLTADLIILVCVPLLPYCVIQARRGSLAALLAWAGLLSFTAYTYIVYCFDGVYTIIFPLYLVLFSLCTYALIDVLGNLEAEKIAATYAHLPLRRVTAGFMICIGLILIAIELPMVLAQIPLRSPSALNSVSTLDLGLLVPASFLAGIWLWRNQPWGYALSAVILIKGITIMTSFLIADYIYIFSGRLDNIVPTLAFTACNLGAYFLIWNFLIRSQRSQ